MSSRFLATMAMTLIAGTLPATPVFAQYPNCDERADLASQVRQMHLEKPGAVETVTHSATVELIRAEDGRWALILTYPSGRSCQLAAGEALAPLQAEMTAKTY
jgi:hypothetical protein